MHAKTSGAVITGMGAICPIGENIAAMRANLRAGRSGIGEIDTFSTEGLRVRHAALVKGFDPLQHFDAARADRLDRTAQMAIVAARQAVAQAGLTAADLASGRIGLVMGICAGGAGHGDMPVLPHDWSSHEQVLRIYRMAHHAQTQAVAHDLGLAGPCLTVSTACASSTSALASALTLIESGAADAVVVDGSDAYSMSIYAGFYALGAMSEQPTSPFSVQLGATFGEGAGCIVLETSAHAEARQARRLGALLGCGATGDAHHITAPQPSGDGLRRAMALALADAGLALADIDYINVHGTGTLDNDIAETIAIRTLFDGAGRVPPLSSSKTYFGHTLGGAGILEFITAMIGMQDDFLPATLHFEQPRPGCELDCVPNAPRPARIDAFLSTSAAFGGINATVLAGRAGLPRRTLGPAAAIAVTGMGIVSPIGIGKDAFHAALREGARGIAPVTRFGVAGLACAQAALVPAFSFRQFAPTVDARRMDRCTQYAVLAALLALKDAGLAIQGAPERIGLHVAMTRGPVAAQLAFQESMVQDGIANLSARHFPAMVFSTVSGQVAQACHIKGANFTFVDGVGAGLQALAHGHHYLQLHPELDALVVLAVDELGPLTCRMFDYLGYLGADGTGPYLGEGAVALVLERQPAALARGHAAYGRIASVQCRNEAAFDAPPGTDGASLAAAIHAAMADAPAPGLVYGAGRGLAAPFGREQHALDAVFGAAAPPLACLDGQLGLAEASGSLFAAAAALLSLKLGDTYPALHGSVPAWAVGTLPRQALVLADSEYGNSAAALFSTMEA